MLLGVHRQFVPNLPGTIRRPGGTFDHRDPQPPADISFYCDPTAADRYYRASRQRSLAYPIPFNLHKQVLSRGSGGRSAPICIAQQPASSEAAPSAAKRILPACHSSGQLFLDPRLVPWMVRVASHTSGKRAAMSPENHPLQTFTSAAEIGTTPAGTAVR